MTQRYRMLMTERPYPPNWPRRVRHAAAAERSELAREIKRLGRKLGLNPNI